MLKSLLVVFSALLAISTAQIVGYGPCPVVKTQKFFSVREFVGVWYQIDFFPNWTQEGKCAHVNYTLVNDNKFNVVNTEVEPDGKLGVAKGFAIRPDPSQEGKLQIKFGSKLPFFDYWIVESDYKNFALVFSCLELKQFNIQYAWILSRVKTLSPDIEKRLKAELKSYKVATRAFRFDDHTLPFCKKYEPDH